MYTNLKDPTVVSVLGPRRVGKTTIINSILLYCSCEFYLGQDSVLVFNKKKNLYLFREIPCDKLSTLISIKSSDLVFLVIDCYFGLELETFEGLALINTNGYSRVLCVLNHLDLFGNWKALKKIKIQIKKKLRYELNSQIKMFCFSGIALNESYFTREISNLTRYLSNVFSNLPIHSKISFHVVVFCLKIHRTKCYEKMFIVGFHKGGSDKTIFRFSIYIPGIGTLRVIKKIRKSDTHERSNYQKKIISETNPKFLIKHEIVKKKKLLFFLIFFKIYQKPKNVYFFKRFFSIESNKFFIPANLNFRIETKNLFDKKIYIITAGKKKSLLRKFNLISDKILLQRNIILEINYFPSNFKFYFDPRYPIVIVKNFLFRSSGAHLKVVIYKHKWNKTRLHSNVFYLISVDWKLFKTLVFFFKENFSNFKKYQKYAKTKGFTMASFFFPIVKPGDSLIGMHSNQPAIFGAHFCILFFGTVLLSNNIQKIIIFKKLKFKGMIFKVLKKNAFIENMFSSEIQISRFIGFSIKTTKGTRGIIKNHILNHKSGSFKAKFEKTIKKGEIVFLNIWFPIKINKILQYNFFHLIPNDLEENNWSQNFFLK